MSTLQTKEETETRQRPSEHGAALGQALAHFVDKIAEREPQLDMRCSSCAFRAGTIPNKMAGTLMDAFRIACGVDKSIFACHHGAGVVSGRNQPTMICAGSLLSQQATFEEIKAMVADAAERVNDGGGR